MLAVRGGVSLGTTRLRSPDGLVHDGIAGSVSTFRRTACEHRWGDMWSSPSLTPTDEITTCLACLGEPERFHLPVLEPS